VPQQKILNQILLLNAEQSPHQILLLSRGFEFPFGYHRAAEMALLRWLAVPQLSAWLMELGAFPQAAHRTHSDLLCLIDVLYAQGLNSQAGQTALARLRTLARTWPLPPAEQHYLLATLVLEPVTWMANFGYRRLVVPEMLALFFFWRAVALALDVPDVPTRFIDLKRFKADYEAQHCQFSPSNQQAAEALYPHLVKAALPKGLSWGVNHILGKPSVVIASLLNQLDSAWPPALGLPPAPDSTQKLVLQALHHRQKLLRRLPERRRPQLALNGTNSAWLENFGPPY
jgi:hypothetical protein